MYIFKSPDDKYNVAWNDPVHNSILNEVEVAERKETGGVLFGRYNERLDTAIIHSISGPPPDSKRAATWFYRGVKGLRLLVATHWKNKHYYLGEWHLHPNASPYRSQTDLIQMLAIAKSDGYNCPEPILLIIGGNKISYEIRVYVSTRTGEFIELRQSS